MLYMHTSFLPFLLLSSVARQAIVSASVQSGAVEQSDSGMCWPVFLFLNRSTKMVSVLCQQLQKGMDVVCFSSSQPLMV